MLTIIPLLIQSYNSCKRVAVECSQESSPSQSFLKFETNSFYWNLSYSYWISFFKKCHHRSLFIIQSTPGVVLWQSWKYTPVWQWKSIAKWICILGCCALFTLYFWPQFCADGSSLLALLMGVQTVPNFVAFSSKSFQYTFVNWYGFGFWYSFSIMKIHVRMGFCIKF